MKIQFKTLEFLGFPNYLVSDSGFVWKQTPDGSLIKLRSKQANKRTGHLLVCLYHAGLCKHFLVHRLVLMAFVGPCPEGMEACHFPDRDPTNNQIHNLRWDTRKNNHQDRKVHGTNNYGETNGSAVTIPSVVKKIRCLYSTGKYQQKDLALMFGLQKANVWCILRRKSWKHI